jgi:hypothetical protein
MKKTVFDTLLIILLALGNLCALIFDLRHHPTACYAPVRGWLFVLISLPMSYAGFHLLYSAYYDARDRLPHNPLKRPAGLGLLVLFNPVFWHALNLLLLDPCR